MAPVANRGGKTLLWLIAVVIATVAGGELILVVLEEVVDVLVEASQAIFMLIFERGFGMPYAKAQGLAAWTSLGFLILLVIVAIWRLTPWVKAKLAHCGQWLGSTRSSVAERWGSARWYQKSAVVIGGLTLLFGLMMVI